MNKGLLSSASDEWSTPIDLFEKLNAEYDFTLDPCADDMNHKCDKYYTKEQNGLVQDWTGERVFCNPPYGKSIGEWVKKAFNEVYFGKCNLVVMLIPARTDTRWFHDYIYNKSHVIFIKGRIKFGGSRHDAPFPSMLVIYKGVKK
ncbi:MAG: adenine methyltransferase [Clostridia bacterium]|nr:adenine methyltransferase [Clostridia bacterium]